MKSGNDDLGSPADDGGVRNRQFRTKEPSSRRLTGTKESSDTAPYWQHSTQQNFNEKPDILLEDGYEWLR